MTINKVFLKTSIVDVRIDREIRGVATPPVRWLRVTLESGGGERFEIILSEDDYRDLPLGTKFKVEVTSLEEKP